MSEASDFVNATDGMVQDLDALYARGATEEVSSRWRFPDGSLVQADWVIGYNAPSKYHVKIVTASGE